jgi:hypothetical protein
MTVSELEEIVGELYLVAPSDFVTVRNELVRQARAAGNRDLADKLQRLRRPTHSAWLVNVLAHHEAAAMKRLSALGRELRDAQTGLDGAELRQLSELRRQVIGDLLDRARQRATDAGLRLTDNMLSEVEATLRAALVDLAGAFTVRSGRLVRPLSHNGFGPRPQVEVTLGVTPGEDEAPEAEREWTYLPVPDELAARRRRGSRDEATVDRPMASAHSLADEVRLGGTRTEAEPALSRATEELAAAESVHWQREHDLADAEASLEAATDRLDWLDSQRMEARRDKVMAQDRLAEARARQTEAVRAVAEARRQLDIARRQAGLE